MLSVLALLLAFKFAVAAEQSLKNATSISLSAMTQIVHYLERRRHGSTEEAYEVGADVWSCGATPVSISPGGYVTLRLRVFHGASPTYFMPGDDDVVQCTVTPPSGPSVVASATPATDKEYDCIWELRFPEQFSTYLGQSAETQQEGIYLVEWDFGYENGSRATAFTVLNPVRWRPELLRLLKP